VERRRGDRQAVEGSLTGVRHGGRLTRDSGGLGGCEVLELAASAGRVWRMEHQTAALEMAEMM
jgi:hypothetical protein